LAPADRSRPGRMTDAVETRGSNRRWRITAAILFPRLVVPLKPEAGSLLPKSIGFQARLPGKRIASVEDLGKITLAPSPYESLRLPPEMNSDLALISLERDPITPEMALSSIEGKLELLLDDISFQMQLPIRPLMLEVLDVSPPLKIGEEREMLHFPFPTGWPYPKFQETVFPSDSFTPPLPELRIHQGFARTRPRAALRWYVKALATSFDVDQFAFLWIALEILAADASSNVVRPYVAPCDHAIPSCPECAESTAKKIQGPSLRKFLEELEVSAADSRELWKARQIFHGNNPLTQETVAAVP
jgi:hypothetical protein